ncbi:MAG: hypothetical protein MZU95_17205 [Desulfomicrobium escambiense]|nr:hypothetical protein [Desulfomicrobium escambiense]
MEEFLQQLTNGLAVGGIYALIALGYTMVYGVLQAHQLRPRRPVHLRRLPGADPADLAGAARTGSGLALGRAGAGRSW